MAEGGTLAQRFGWLVGTGPGAGFGLLILLCGIGGTLIGLSGYVVKEIRDLNEEMPDYRLPPVGLVRRMEPVFVMDRTPYPTETASFSNNPVERNEDSTKAPEENQKAQTEE
jgi:hypothetical protein